MKKRVNYLIIILLCGLFSNYGCTDLSVAPQNILNEEQVFQSESAVEAYMVSLYDELPMEDHSWYVGGNHLANRTDESVSAIADERNGIGDGTWMPWWGYEHVRNVNDLLEKLPEKSTLGETKKEQILGEAHFIRAYYYFALVKRYGGVPIIEEAQTFTGDNLSELQVPRDGEAAVYDFIASDLDSAAAMLGEINDEGRATRSAALALKSRAMLYAASVAEYGSVQLDGLVGIPSSEAERYWQSAYEAAEAVIESENHALYDQLPDKAENFQQLFLDEDGNPEVILARHYSYPQKSHGYDNWYIPFGIRGPDGYSSRLGPTLELVEQFEYIDGSSGELRIENESGDPIYYDHPTDLFENKDPRLLGSVIVPFSEFQGNVIDIQAGLYDQGEKYEAGDYAAMYNPETHEPDNENGTIHIVGLNGIGGIAKTQTGFYVRKYLDTDLPQSRRTTSGSEQQWIELRYGEVLLNYAEAAVELGRTEDAGWAVNKIRERAGIKQLENNEVTLQRVRKERLAELAFENHRWWDYRRWRTADNVMNNTRFHALRPYYDLDADAYRFEVDETGQYPKTFQPRVYYERIDPGEIAKNPELVQNPNY